jgi:hypothetical protein
MGLDVRQMFHAARTLLHEGIAQIRPVGAFDLVAPAGNNVPMAVTQMTFSAFQNRRLNPILNGMAEHAFELAGGATVKIVRKFETVIIEAHVKRAINELFPPSGRL